KLASGVTISQPTLDILLPPGHLKYDLAVTGIWPVTNLTPLVAQLSSDGINWSTANAYVYGGNASLSSSSPANSPQGSSSATGFTLFGQTGNATLSNLMIEIFANPSSAVQLLWRGFYYNGTNYYHVDGGGIHTSMGGAPKGIRLLFGAGNIAAG